MYESFYGLKEKPFSMLPDPGFLYLSKKHQMALTLLEYGLLNQAGFCVVSGETGSGKTTLLRKLLENISDDVTVGMITNTHKGFGELLDWVLSAYGIHEQGKSTVDMHQCFIDFLIEQYAANKTTLLIVDEAQNMSAEKLEELRMLSNLNADKDQVLQVILAGQPELKTTLRLPELRQFAQRIAVDYHLGPLNEEETYGYIHHRLEVAGADKEIFSEAACDRIYEYSGGIPRLINLLCDTVMVYGYADQKDIIDESLVEEMIQERMKDSIVPLAGNIQTNSKTTVREEGKKPKTNLRHYPLADQQEEKVPAEEKTEPAAKTKPAAKAAASAKAEKNVSRVEQCHEKQDDSRHKYEQAVESIEQMVSESVDIEAPEIMPRQERSGDVRRREPNSIAVIEQEDVIRRDSWKWIAISAIAVAVTVLTLVLGGVFTANNETGTSASSSTSESTTPNASQEQLQEIPERIKKQLNEAETLRQELSRRQDEDRARVTALEDEARKLQRERDEALAKAKAEEKSRVREAAIIEAAAKKEIEAIKKAESAKAEALAAAREKAIILEELREAERKVHEKALQEKELMRQNAILELDSEEAAEMQQEQAEVRPVVKPRPVPKKEKEEKSFSADPCSSSTARFLSTCR